MELRAKKRKIIGKKVSQLREQDIIPAVLYGHGIDNVNLEIDRRLFDKIYKQAGENTLIDLSVDKAEPVKVLIAEMQIDAIKDLVDHVDLRQIRMDEKIIANVHLEIVGESPAVKDLGAVLVHSLNELEIKCLPSDLIHEIKINISKLEKIGDTVSLSDLEIPEKVEIIGHEKDETVASVIEQKVEEEPEVSVDGVEGEEGVEEGEEGEGDEEGIGSEKLEGEKEEGKTSKPDEGKKE